MVPPLVSWTNHDIRRTLCLLGWRLRRDVSPRRSREGPRGTIGARPVTEVHVHPESRHWFIHTDRAETRYVAELGYYQRGRLWVTIATSPPAVTPPDTVSTDQTVRFATIPALIQLTQLAALAKQGVPTDLPPLDAAQERALAELIARHLTRQDSGSSAEIAELVQGRGEQEVSAAQLQIGRA